MEDRREYLTKLIKLTAEELIDERRTKIMENFRLKNNIINKEILAQVEQLFSKAGDKEYMYWEICFLHTGLLMDTFVYKMSLYGPLYLMELEPVSSSVCFDFIYQYFAEDIEVLIRILRQKMLRVSSHEVMAIKEYHNKYYIGMVNKYIKDMLPVFMAHKSFFQLNKGRQFAILFGEYMGEKELIWNISQ